MQNVLLIIDKNQFENQHMSVDIVKKKENLSRIEKGKFY